FFFFQAEDGIRDGHVTGVQTCALPISLAGSLVGTVVVTAAAEARPTAARGVALVVAALLVGLAALWHNSSKRESWLFTPLIGYRSEERRVGKECRARWAA